MRHLALPALLAALVLSCSRPADLPKLYPVPDAQVVDETGAPLRLGAMKGRVSVYNFIFTHCSGTCPIMTYNMRTLTRKIDADAPVRFVSISVDPARDTPAVLAAYAKQFRNDPRWTFVTGDRDAIVRLSVDGFKLAAGDPVPGGEALLHSSKFVVADKEGMIRAYFDGADGAAMDQAARAVEQLAEE